MKQWTEITTLDEWKSILEKSSETPFVILKHSTRCPVSTNALNEFDAYLNEKPNEANQYYMVKVIEARPVSNQIAEDVDLEHASPQIIYVKDQEKVWNTSHWSITQEHITAVLD